MCNELDFTKNRLDKPTGKTVAPHPPPNRHGTNDTSIAHLYPLALGAGVCASGVALPFLQHVDDKLEVQSEIVRPIIGKYRQRAKTRWFVVQHK